MMSFRQDSLYDEMARMHREMSRLLSADTSPAHAGVFPPINVYDDGESYVIRAEMPGVDPETLDIESTSKGIAIKGERKRDDAAQGVSVHRRERDYGIFNRSFELPQPVDPDKINASYKLGVLEVILPKAAEAKPRKVSLA